MEHEMLFEKTRKRFKKLGEAGGTPLFFSGSSGCQLQAAGAAAVLLLLLRSEAHRAMFCKLPRRIHKTRFISNVYILPASCSALCCSACALLRTSPHARRRNRTSTLL
jgi:hypothetical protein